MADGCTIIVIEKVSGTPPISHWGLNAEPQRLKDLSVSLGTSKKTKTRLENTPNRK